MSPRVIFALRSVASVLGGYFTVAAGTILTFNVLVGRVTIHSTPPQLILGTIGAVISGLGGGVVAGLIAPRLPLTHAAAVLILIGVDTVSVLSKGPGPVWFDLAGSAVLAITVLIGGWLVAQHKV